MTRIDPPNGGHKTHTIHVWYIYLHLVDFYGKCREIYHTWMIWERSQLNRSRITKTQMGHNRKNLVGHVKKEFHICSRMFFSVFLGT